MRRNFLLVICAAATFGVAAEVSRPAVAAPATGPAASAPAAAAQTIPNPIYAAWANFKSGSTVTMKHTMHLESDQMKMDREFETVSKLVSISDDKVTIETTTSMGGQTQTHKQEIPATIDPNNPQAPKEVGNEAVSASGQSFPCKIYELEIQQGDAKAHARVWISAKVPGGMVKMESDFQQGKVTMKDNGTLSKFEAK